MQEMNQNVENQSFNEGGAPAAPKQEPKVRKYSIEYLDKNAGYDWGSGSPKAVPQKKRGARWLLYLAPFLIVAQWIIAYLVIIPFVYDTAIDFIEWFTPAKFIEALKDSQNVMRPLLAIIILRIYNWLTLAGLITTLFFIGRSIQYREPEKNLNAKLHGNEPYVLTIGLLEEIKLIRDTDTARAAQAVKLLNERLRNESAFGEGSDAAVNCENEIAANLEKLQRAIPGLRNEEDLDDATESIEILCQRSLSKLKVRIELKKR